MRFQHQLGLTGGRRGRRQLVGDPQPFGRGARLPAHVGQREQRIGEHAGIIGRLGTFYRGTGEPDGTGKITIGTIGELAR